MSKSLSLASSSTELPFIVEHGPALWYAALAVFVALVCAALEWSWRWRTRRKRRQSIAAAGVITAALDGTADGQQVAIEGTLIVGDDPAAPMRAGERASGVSAVELHLPGAAFARRKLRHAHRAPRLQLGVGADVVVLDGAVEVELGGEERHATKPFSSDTLETAAWVPAGLRRAADACAPVYRLLCAGDRVVALGRLHRGAGGAHGYREAPCTWTLRPVSAANADADAAHLRLFSAAPLPRTGGPLLRSIVRRAVVGALIFVGATWVAGRALASSESSTAHLQIASGIPLTRERALDRLVERWQTQPRPDPTSVMRAASVHRLRGRCEEAATLLLEHRLLAAARDVGLGCETPYGRTVAARAALADGHYADASDLFDGVQLPDQIAGHAFIAHLVAHQWERASRIVEQQDSYLPGLHPLAQPCLSRALRARTGREPLDAWWDPVPAETERGSDYAVRMARAKCQLLAADSAPDDAAATALLAAVAPRLGGRVAGELALARGLPYESDRGASANWHHGILLDWEPMIAGYESSPALARAASDRLTDRPGREEDRADVAVSVAIATELVSPREADAWWRIVHAGRASRSAPWTDRSIDELLVALAVRRGARAVAQRIAAETPGAAEHLAGDVRRWIGIPVALGERDDVSNARSGAGWLVLGTAARPVLDSLWARQRIAAPEHPYAAMVRAGNRALLAERRGETAAADDHRARARRHYEAVMDVKIAVILRLVLAY